MRHLEIGGNAKNTRQDQDRREHLETLTWGDNLRRGDAPVSDFVLFSHVKPSIGDGDVSFVRDKAQGT